MTLFASRFARQVLSISAGAALALSSLVGCSDDPPGGTGGAGTGSGTSSTSGGTGGNGGTGGSGGTGGMDVASLDAILAELRSDRDGALCAHAQDTGWPVPLTDGYLFVS